MTLYQLLNKNVGYLPMIMSSRVYQRVNGKEVEISSQQACELQQEVAKKKEEETKFLLLRFRAAEAAGLVKSGSVVPTMMVSTR